MATLEEISEKCLAVCQVPIVVSENSLRIRVESHFKHGRILDTDKVDGIESSRNLTRIVLLCSSTADVDHMCKEVREEEIQIEDEHFIVKYQKAIACELPERWEDFKIPEPQSSADSTREPESHVGPDLPPRRPEQQIPPNVWPPETYGAMSGFYQNFPMNPQGDADHIQGAGDLKMNQGDMHQQMPMFANAQGQPRMQGHEHQQGHPPGMGPQHGTQQNFQVGPGGQGQYPPGFPMYRMPPMPQPYPNDHHNAPGGQNMQFRPGMQMPMPMIFYDQRGQVIRFPGPGFPGMPPQHVQQGGGLWRPPPQQPSGPPPPYNDGKFRGQGQSTEVKSSTDRPDYGAARQSEVIADQDEQMQKLQAKLERENEEETMENQG
ncbi:proline-rich protein 2-like [Mercenaria mercenaria]|uniref:proline-rich protein 2-like n=1 Tax=Mercenaria mercenaria TaxID=6596 RepID=UPI00234F3E55|nr:proline-rich protein 2-like [Mercenaria mercenaria]